MMRRLNTKKAYCSKKSCACVTDDPGDTYTFISCAHFAYKYQIDVGSLLGILTLQLKEHHTSYSHACTYMHHLYSSPYMCALVVIMAIEMMILTIACTCTYAVYFIHQMIHFHIGKLANKEKRMQVPPKTIHLHIGLSHIGISLYV